MFGDTVAKVETRKITDFRPDPSNANQGTERGLRILDNSLAEVGLGRSAVADKNGILIAGNKTQERSVDSGFEDAIVVHTTGKQLVVVQRDDLDLLDDNPNNPARRMAYYDNVTSQHMAWDAAQIAADVEAGVNLDAMFTPNELADITGTIDAPGEFATYDENIDTEYCCPKCGYKWSGKPNADSE